MRRREGFEPLPVQIRHACVQSIMAETAIITPSFPDS